MKYVKVMFVCLFVFWENGPVACFSEMNRNTSIWFAKLIATWAKSSSLI